MHAVHAPVLPLTHDAPTQSRTAGPLPKSDSVQSLVSLMKRPTAPVDIEDCTIRGVDTDARTHSVVVMEDTDQVVLSGLGLETLTIDALALGLSLCVREVSLAANVLQAIDLSPLASCPALVVLTLNSNRLTSIDLRPLSACKNLQRLWLHDNRLEHIDLEPLASCKTLRSLYLEDNSIHSQTLDLSPLINTQNLRSLRLGGNRLSGKLDLTPLFQCPALSVFNIDTCVSLVADGDPSMARISSALRRVTPDIKFTGRPADEPARPVAPRRSPPLTPPRFGGSPGRPRRRSSPPVSPPGGVEPTRRKPQLPPPAPAPPPPAIKAAPVPNAVVKVLLVGFRRLARYTVEDRLSHCGKVMIRASTHDVATRDPSALLDSHLVLMYAPMERALRQVTVVVGRIPVVIVGSERYRSTADNRMLELLDRFHFFADPVSVEETKKVYEMGQSYAVGEANVPSTTVQTVGASTALCEIDSSPVIDEGDQQRMSNMNYAMRKSYSESSLASAVGPIGIELEHIEDEDDSSTASGKSGPTPMGSFHRSRSADGITEKPLSCALNRPAITWSEVSRKLTERRNKKVGRGWGSYLNSELSLHGKNKLRAERASVEIVFTDLGGYANADNCAAIARACGLPKCAGPVLFRAAFGSSFDIESTTPEAGVPNIPLERKHRRISRDSFLAYWDSRLKTFDGEERLSNILEDNHHASSKGRAGFEAGHSEYGAPLARKARGVASPSERISDLNMMEYMTRYGDSDSGSADGMRLIRSRSSNMMPSDLCCPCDAGVEALITSFMEGRSSRFGSFALVKMCEAIAIGSALVMYGLRGMNKNRVGGRARPVCPKEVRNGKLNAALVAAEVGIFEGVASGLSMDQIRSVKGCFATMASPGAIPRSGIAIESELSVDDVKKFCSTRKTLMPGVVELVMGAHCRDAERMTLSEFAVFLSVVNNISSNGAVDYLYTVIDVDQDERWTLPDLRQFHMEKERMWLQEGMAVSDLSDLWMNLMDMIRPLKASRGVARKEFCRLGSKDRKLVLQSLLFVDDDHSLLNIRRTMELSKQSASAVVVM